jgi:hypothetical protein
MIAGGGAGRPNAGKSELLTFSTVNVLLSVKYSTGRDDWQLEDEPENERAMGVSAAPPKGDVIW